MTNPMAAFHLGPWAPPWASATPSPPIRHLFATIRHLFPSNPRVLATIRRFLHHRLPAPCSIGQTWYLVMHGTWRDT